MVEARSPTNRTELQRIFSTPLKNQNPKQFDIQCKLWPWRKILHPSLFQNKVRFTVFCCPQLSTTFNTMHGMYLHCFILSINWNLSGLCVCVCVTFTGLFFATPSKNNDGVHSEWFDRFVLLFFHWNPVFTDLFLLLLIVVSGILGCCRLSSYNLIFESYWLTPQLV